MNDYRSEDDDEPIRKVETDVNTETPNGVLTAFLECVDEYQHIVVVAMKKPGINEKGETTAQLIIGHDAQHLHETIGILRSATIMQEEVFRNDEDD